MRTIQTPTEPTDAPDYLTPSEAAIVLRVSAPTIRKLAADGRLAAVRVGRQWRIERDSLRSAT